jgi:hypothetical protein
MDEQDKTYEGIELLKALDLPIDGESSKKNQYCCLL